MDNIYEDNAYREINIALLGSPLIGIFLSKTPNIINNVSVFDINNDMVNLTNEEHNGGGKVIASRYNAIDKFPLTLAGRYDAFIMDPPWHNEYYALFADRGWEALRPLGRIYMSTFAPETRPEASQELRELYTRFMNGGFDIISIIPEFFGYEIPQYERKIFEAAGIKVNSRGNYGQLVVLEKRPLRTETCLTEEYDNKLITEHNYELKGTTGRSLTLWVENKSNDEIINTPLEISSPNETIVYTNTSRSQRRKDGVNILTDEHIAYHVTNPYRFILIYPLWKEGLSEQICIDRIKSHDLYRDIREEVIISDVKNSYHFLANTLNSSSIHGN